MKTIIIGAGQAGLATGRALAERGEEFIILEGLPESATSGALAGGLEAYAETLPVRLNTRVDSVTLVDGFYEVMAGGERTSGVQPAIELAATHRVFLAGRPTVHIPDAVFRYAGGLYWAFIYRVLTKRTPIGRTVAGVYGTRGNPLVNVSMKDVAAAGVPLVPRVSGG